MPRGPLFRHPSARFAAWRPSRRPGCLPPATETADLAPLVLLPVLLVAWIPLTASVAAAEPRAGAAAGDRAARPPRDRAGDGGDRAGDERFLRVSRDSRRKPLALETSIVTYGERPQAAAAADPRAPLQVDLVGAVHLGSRAYYATLDRLFADYDAVLYELVAPDNARVPKPGRKPAGAIGSAQQGLTKMLGLEFQLDRIDYAADNFVHADLSPQEFDAAMAKRGESWWTMFTRVMQESMARADRGGRQPGGDVGFSELFGILFGSNRELILRRLMAEQFTDMEVLTAAFGGEQGSSLITDRNAAALDVLRQQIAKGRRKIAIFYGAAHMDDFDRRLRQDFGLQPRETVWLEAWDLRDPADRN